MKPMKLSKTQTLLPSGVAISKDGKYHFWQCSVSGLPTFAKPEYWVKIMAKYGTEENLVKTYVCKKAKQLLDAGETPANIVKLLSITESPEAKKERKATKEVAKERKLATKKVRKVRLKAVKTTKVMEVVNGVETEVVKKTYPWTDDPHYFAKSGPGIVDFASDTGTCHYPPRFLDQLCNGCPIYDKCAYTEKYAPGAHLDPKKTAKQVAPKVKTINPFTKEEIEAEKAS